ncbi:MAG TPA: hypothetical protein VM328_01720, partial [Fimbriimonadaceae bacterium]|nr:hypothetical protein [Fimbriimonadaceae bacterium]
FFYYCPGIGVLPYGFGKTTPEVFVLHADGDTRVISDNGLIEYDGVVSPDGRFAALSVTDYFDGTFYCELYRFSTNAVKQRLMTESHGGCDDPSDWSRSGWILFSTWSEGPEVSLSKIRQDGTQERALTPFPSHKFDSTVYDAQWALNETAIVFYGGVLPEEDTPTPYGIWFMDADGHNPRPIAVAESGPRYHNPEVSPSGRKVAYLRSYRRTQEDIFVTRLGGTTRRLARAEGYWSSLAWSPDGSRLLVMTEVSNVGRMSIIEVGSGRSMRIPAPEGVTVDWRYAPVWSPSGRYVAFLGYRSPDYARAVFVVDLNDYSIAQITRFDVETRLFAWYR